MTHIEESGLYIGDFPETNFFHLEKSEIYKNIGEGVKTVECILNRDAETILYIEAKSSAPKPGNREDFDKFINEITDKFIHSNDLFFSVILKRIVDKTSELPPSFREINYETTKIKAVLIINNFEFSCLSPIQVALEKSLKRQIKTWQLKVSVMNHEAAAERKLIKLKVRK